MLNLLRNFKNIIIRNGKSEIILDNKLPMVKRVLHFAKPTLTPRSNYFERVIKLMDRNKGREFPGIFNLIIVQKFFKK